MSGWKQDLRSAPAAGLAALAAALVCVLVAAAAYLRVPWEWWLFCLAVGSGAFLLGALRPLGGFRFFLLILPLFNNLPALRVTGWFPPPVLFFLLWFAGWAAMRLRNRKLTTPGGWLGPALLIWTLLVIASAVVTMMRYVAFWPLSGEPLLIFPVNGLGEANTTAIREVFTPLAAFLCGPLVWWAASELHRDESRLNGSLAALAAGLAGAVVFGLWQSLPANRAFGATEHFAGLGQINATFIDPNALGSFLVLALPCVAALAVRAKRRVPAVAGAAVLAAGALYVLLQSGSRTGAIGLVPAAGLVAASAALAAWKNAPARMFRVLAAAGTVALFAGVLVVAGALVSDASLGERIEGTQARAAEGGLIGTLLSDRYGLWYRAAMVIREFPLSGVGFGAFRTEIPNIMMIEPGMPFYRDNAANWILQVFAETGAIGLLVALAVVALVVAQGLRALLRDAESLPDAAAAWPAAGMLALVALFVTGPHLSAPEVRLLFWTLAGLTTARLLPKQVAGTSAPGGVLLAGGGLLVLLSAGLLTVNSLGPLSVRTMTERVGQFGTAGFYAPQTNEDGELAFWSQKEAWMRLPLVPGEYRTRLTVVHPDAGERPVDVEVLVDGKHVAEVTFTGTGAAETVDFSIVGEGRRSREVRFRVSRTWSPGSWYPGSNDDRNLGVLVEQIEPVRFDHEEAGDEGDDAE